MFRLIGAAVTPQEIANLCNARRIELGISQTDLDHAAGWAGGYSSKLFAHDYKKNFGVMSLQVMLEALGLKLAVVADDEALPAITRRIVEERRRNPQSPNRLMPRGTRQAQRERRAALEAAELSA
jgi:hypothetical protein